MMKEEVYTLIVVALVVLMIYCVMVVISKFSKKSRVEEMKEIMVSIIENHKGKLCGNNRFIIDRDVLMSIFPDDNESDIDALLIRLSVEKIIERDPLDNTLCIR